jgi:formylglycine-generating enzyme required for sulfatase activity
MDTFEVTVGRFRKFIAHLERNPGWQPVTGAGAHPGVKKTGWNQGFSWTLPSAADLTKGLRCDDTNATWTDEPGPNENDPINCLNWFEAFAFCVWDGGRLPTEAEWEYAAAGGSENRLYPWGGLAPSKAQAVFGCQDYPQGNCMILPVGSMSGGQGRWGQRDLAGNVWEWGYDAYAPYSDEACDDCVAFANGNSQIFRGGAFGNASNPPRDDLRTAMRNGGYATARDGAVGLRCVRAAL